jgi:hypothetical protein
VSLKEIQFTYSKFQQIINTTTHQVSSVGGSSIPYLELNCLYFSLSIGSIYVAERYSNRQKAPFHCIGAR